MSDFELDCGDNSCYYATNKGGMRTNGGCRCMRNQPEKTQMWLRRKVCNLELEIAQLKEKCTEYEKVIGIYAKSENWNDRKFLIVDDIELRQHESNNPCGKWARKILEKWKGKG